MTKPDNFTLPRIDDLLDQLDKANHLSTLDLAAGFWQVQIHLDSQEKTAFTTHQGVFEFRVMPFGLTNAPAVFQRLMQQVLTELNPDEGPDFVSACMDDVLVFSEGLEKQWSTCTVQSVSQSLGQDDQEDPNFTQFLCRGYFKYWVYIDVMDLPTMEQENRHVLIFQDYLTEWPMVFPMPNQKTTRVVRILVEEVIPLIGVPKALLSDRGTNLLSHLMMDVCQLLGIQKLSTTAYHPQLVRWAHREVQLNLKNNAEEARC